VQGAVGLLVEKRSFHTLLSGEETRKVPTMVLEGDAQPPTSTAEGGRPSEVAGGTRPAGGESKGVEVSKSSPSSSVKEKSNYSSSKRASSKPSYAE
jgi:hypothetical protein